MRRISMSFAKEALYNAFRFVINVGFIFLFQMMFHAENTLTAVALSVGFTMLPNSELHIRPGAMCCIVLLLYIGGESLRRVHCCTPLSLSSSISGFSFCCWHSSVSQWK